MDTSNIPLLAAKIFKRMPRFMNPISRSYNRARHESMMKKIDPLCSRVAKAAESQLHVCEDNGGPIWILWWQGLDGAPAVVQACIKSIQRNAGKRKVIIISRDNVREYAQLPDYIYAKLKSQHITLTHFSDILRFNLLHNHGGLWMDATLLSTGNLDTSEYFGPFFTCSGFADPTNFFVTEGKWTGFFIGGCSDEPLFTFMNNFFFMYWKENDTLIDYFLIDYALKYAYDHHIGSLHAWVQLRWSKDNPNLFDLAPVITQPFDSHLWSQLTANTDVFKLSWKKPKAYPENSFGKHILSIEK